MVKRSRRGQDRLPPDVGGRKEKERVNILTPRKREAAGRYYFEKKKKNHF